MIFFLSAIPPAEMDSVVQKLVATLKPGGSILFRDYGRFDMAMLRNHRKGNKVAEDCYLKADGTFATYFSIEALTSIFSKAGCSALECKYCTVRLQNRKRGLTMYRVFIQATFVKEESL
eukprot:TRINITY_DN5723_c0_g1_i2.p1 TRINITY_DN5723_c0_g1~~TRINITY_DN5723_c0_g1_i2.p1  ORF type:complete len:119 (-),score=14.49 TRINITY_DN5723_c0_g1_i2:109-465(-)